jgi:hypothetical protein
VEKATGWRPNPIQSAHSPVSSPLGYLVLLYHSWWFSSWLQTLWGWTVPPMAKGWAWRCSHITYFMTYHNQFNPCPYQWHLDCFHSFPTTWFMCWIVSPPNSYDEILSLKWLRMCPHLEIGALQR